MCSRLAILLALVAASSCFSHGDFGNRASSEESSNSEESGVSNVKRLRCGKQILLTGESIIVPVKFKGCAVTVACYSTNDYLQQTCITCTTWDCRKHSSKSTQIASGQISFTNINRPHSGCSYTCLPKATTGTTAATTITETTITGTSTTTVVTEPPTKTTQGTEPPTETTAATSPATAMG